MRSITVAAIWSSPNTDSHLLSPQVRGDRRRPPLVGVGKGLEEQLRPVRVEREKPELVDDERASLADERGLPAGLPVVVDAPQAHYERERREEARLGLLSHASVQRADVMCVLPVPTSPMGARSSPCPAESSTSSDSRLISSGYDTADQS